MQAVQEAVTRIKLDTSSIPPAAAQASRAIGGIAESAQVSAAQTRNAIRMLPAQFTDIATQIAGGQNIGLILLQQGGQIRDSFGSIRGALEGISTVLTPARLALLGAAGAVATLATAYAQASREQDAIVRGLVLSGGAAGVTADKVNDLARAQAAVAGTRGEAASALTALASAGTVAAAQLAGATDAAIRLERAGGPAVEETVKKFIELGRDPVGALVALNRQENFLTLELYRQVKALQDQGRQFEAAAVAQQEYTRVGLERAERLSQQLGTLQRLWQGVGTEAKRAWDAILNVGRPDTLSEALARVDNAIIANQRRTDRADGYNPASGRRTEGADAQLERLQAQREALRETQRLLSRSADADAARYRETTAAIAKDQKAQPKPAREFTIRPMDSPGLDSASQAALAAINGLDEVKLAGLSAQLDKLFEYRAAGLFGPEVNAAIERTRDQLVDLGDKIRAANLPAALPDPKSDFLRSEKAGYEATDRFLKEQGDRAAAELGEIAKKGRENFQAALGDVFTSAFRGQFRSIEELWKTTVQRLVAEAAAADLTAWLFGKGKGGNLAGLFSGLGGFLSDGFDAIFGGGRAGGGPVGAGRAYLVGEQGPELLLMGGRGGHIVPNSALGGLGGGMVVEQSVTNYIDSRTDRAFIAQAVQAGMQRTEQNIWRQMRARGLA